MKSIVSMLCDAIDYGKKADILIDMYEKKTNL